MADNFISYNRFTTLPPNIADFGSTVEELKLQRGSPDRNPALSPLPIPYASLRRLFLKPRGSDQLRLGEPDEPDVDPYEGPQSTLSLSRNALKKLNGPILTDLEQMVSGGSLTEDTRSLMQDSFRRVLGLRAYLDDINKMTENIYVRSVAASRG